MTPDRAEIFGGVDTHKQVHVAAALDAAGRLLATAEFDAAPHGYRELAGWLRSWGAVCRVGVEGTGSYGASLTRHLAAAGVEVVEVNRPNRQTRRRRGKTDTVDAEAAARAALSGEAAAVPKSADGCVEAIRTLSVARRSAVKARTVAGNQINAVAVTAPEQVKDLLRGLKTPQMIKICARWRIGVGGAPAAGAAKRALRALARRHQALTAEIETRRRLLALCEQANPAAAALLTAAGDNPERTSEAAFAALCGDIHPRAPEPATGSTAAATAKPTRPCGASPAARPPTKHRLSTRRETIRCQAPHRTRDRLLKSPTEPTCADTATNTASPSTPQPKPSTPTPPASQHSNEASTTTATSPNATNNTSSKSRLDKHRSIIVDTIIAWSDEILAWHCADRASNGRIEGINNLLQVLRRSAHGFTNPTNFEARGILVT